MTRKMALEVLKIALIQGDTSLATRTYIENRISMKTYAEYRQKYLAV